MNLLVGVFLNRSELDGPIDAARLEFNLFVRWITVPIAMILVLAMPSTASEILTRERAKETWTSLLATPLTGREIVRATILASVWRLREFLSIILALWTLGLIAGAIHPLGYLISLMMLAASIGLLSTWGVLAALRTKDQSRAVAQSLNLTLGLLLSSTVVPFLLPSRLSSVLLAAGSHPLVFSLSLASYREVRGAFRYVDYPTLHWIELNTGEGPLAVLAACMLGIAGAALGGWLCWRYALANFDRLVGRPWREIPAVSGEGSLLAEPVRAV